MSREEVARGLGILEAHAPGKADILIYGGEPLLEPDTVTELAGIAPDRFNLCLATGGMSFPEGTGRALAERNSFVIVSIDGAREIHNSLRPLPGGDSYEMAVSTFEAFRNAGCRVGLSLTVTRENASRVRDDFGFLMDELKPDDMGLNIWMHPGRKPGRNPYQARWEDVFSAVTACLSDALSRGVYVEQLFRRLRPLVTRSPRLVDCPSRGGRLVFVPGGGISPCDCMAAAGMHTIQDPGGVPTLLQGFSRIAPVFREDCLSCPCVSLCGGGCMYDALALTGSLSGVRTERCGFERALLHWMVGMILDGLPPERTPGVLTGSELRAFLPRGILAPERMPQPEGMLSGEMG